jgi:RNA polymerase sigma-70 factor, ECF subfamily
VVPLRETMLKLPDGEREQSRGVQPERGLGPDLLGPLAKRASRGERVAIRHLLEAITPQLFNVVRSVVGNVGVDAEDVTQEVLVAVVHAMPAFRAECTVLHYATRIAVRTALAARRRALSGDLRLEQMQRDTAVTDPPPPSPGDEVLSARRRDLVRSLLDELPDAQANAFAMRILLGYSMQEVATTSGAPLNTVRSRIRLAKEALRRRIEQDPTIAEMLGARRP